MVSLPEQPPAGRANSGSTAVNRLRPEHSSLQLPPNWYPPLAPILECASTVGAGPPIQGSGPTWGGTSYPEAGLTTIGAGPPTCGGGVAIRATCPLPRGEAGCSDQSRGRGSYCGAGPTYSLGLEVGPDGVRGVHSGIDLKSKVSRGDLSYGMLRKTLLHAYRLAIHQQSPAYTNWCRVTYWEF